MPSIQNPQPVQRQLAWWMILACAAFAPMGVLIKLALAHQNQAEVLITRGLIALFVIVLVARANGVSLKTKRPLAHAYRCAVGVSAISCWFFAIGKLPLATAFTMYFSSSLWVAVVVVAGAVWMSYSLKTEPAEALANANRASPSKPSMQADWSMATLKTKQLVRNAQLAPAQRVKAVIKRQWPLIACIGAGFVGVVLALAPNMQSTDPMGALVGLAAGGISAWAYTQIAALGKLNEPTERVVFYFSAATVLLGLLMLPFMGISPWSPVHALYLLGAGSLAVLGQWAMTKAYAGGTPLIVANLQFGVVPLAALLGMVFFGEYLPVLAWSGIVLIVASAAASVVIRRRQDS